MANPNDGYTAVLHGDHGIVTISGDGDTKVPLPVGEWKLLEYTLDRTKPRAANRIFSSGPTFISAAAAGKCQAVKVREGKTTLFPFGPPFKLLVKVLNVTPGRTGNPKYAALGLEIRGSAGEVVTRLQVNGKRPREPVLTIFDPDGNAIEQGRFRFG